MSNRRRVLPARTSVRRTLMTQNSHHRLSYGFASFRYVDSQTPRRPPISEQDFTSPRSNRFEYLGANWLKLGS